MFYNVYATPQFENHWDIVFAAICSFRYPLGGLEPLPHGYGVLLSLVNGVFFEKEEIPHCRPEIQLKTCKSRFNRPANKLLSTFNLPNPRTFSLRYTCDARLNDDSLHFNDSSKVNPFNGTKKDSHTLTCFSEN